MRIHANHADYIKYDVFLDGAKVTTFVWSASEEDSYVEVNDFDEETQSFRLISPPPLCAVSKRSGKMYPMGYQGTEEDKNGKQVRIETIVVTAPWSQWTLAPTVKRYGKVEIRVKQ